MIRLAQANEANWVHQVMLLAFEEYRHLDVPSSALNESVCSIEEALLGGTEQAILYFEGDEAPAGSARFKTDGLRLYFFRLSVRPEARGRGIAKAMLAWLETYAREQGIPELQCRVRLSVPQNIELYRSVGYCVDKEETVVNPNGFPVRTVLMSKAL